MEQQTKVQELSTFELMATEEEIEAQRLIDEQDEFDNKEGA